MRKNDLLEIKKMDLKALKNKAKQASQEVADLVFELKSNKQKNLKSVKNKRKDLAQVLTILKQKELLERLEDQNNAEK